jgi:hypothetical protein
MRAADDVPNIRYSSFQEAGKGGPDISAANTASSQYEFISEDQSDNRGAVKTAGSLGLKLTEGLPQLADEMIESLLMARTGYWLLYR